VAKSDEGSATESSESVEDIEEISPELEKKFKRRFEETVYTRWLKRTHPESMTFMQLCNFIVYSLQSPQALLVNFHISDQ